MVCICARTPSFGSGRGNIPAALPQRLGDGELFLTEGFALRTRITDKNSAFVQTFCRRATLCTFPRGTRPWQTLLAVCRGSAGQTPVGLFVAVPCPLLEIDGHKTIRRKPIGFFVYMSGNRLSLRASASCGPCPPVRLCPAHLLHGRAECSLRFRRKCVGPAIDAGFSNWLFTAFYVFFRPLIPKRAYPENTACGLRGGFPGEAATPSALTKASPAGSERGAGMLLL